MMILGCSWVFAHSSTQDRAFPSGSSRSTTARVNLAVGVAMACVSARVPASVIREPGYVCCRCWRKKLPQDRLIFDQEEMGGRY